MDIVLDVSEFQSTAQLDHLLSHAEDNVVAVYIKATQGLSYRDSLCDAFAGCCIEHNTRFGYYDFLTNAPAADQGEAFISFVKSLKHAPTVRPMTDAEGAYNKWSAGIMHWEAAVGGAPVLYGPLSNMDKYKVLQLPKWVAQYDSLHDYRPQDSEIAAYRSAGYLLWQWTSNYMGLNQDASVLIGDFDLLKAPAAP